MEHLCKCDCGQRHNLGSYYFDTDTSGVFWFLNPEHKNRWLGSRNNSNTRPRPDVPNPTRIYRRDWV